MGDDFRPIERVGSATLEFTSTTVGLSMKLTIDRGQDGSATVTVRSEAGDVVGQLEFWPGSHPSDDQIWQAVREIVLGSVGAVTVH